MLASRSRTASLSLRLRRLSSLPREQSIRFGEHDGRALHDVAAPLAARDCSVSGTGLLASRSRTASLPLRLRRLSSLPRKMIETIRSARRSCSSRRRCSVSGTGLLASRSRTASLPLRLRRLSSLPRETIETIRSARWACPSRRRCSVSGTGLLGSRSRTASPPLRLRRLSSLPRKRAHPLGACCARDRDDAALRQRHGIASCSLTVLPLTRLAVDPRYRGKTDSLKSRGARLSYFTTSLLCQRLGIALLPDGFAVIAPPRLSSLPRGRLNRFNLFDDRDLHVHGAARLQQWHGLFRAPGRLHRHCARCAYHPYRGNRRNDSVSALVAFFVLAATLLRQ